ncbi:MAG: class I SAM-dependent methyltransferase [Rhodospirillales bacterium]|nr:class I SAM-dependent methyltransferase [Rhodospirillales bacterium]
MKPSDDDQPQRHVEETKAFFDDLASGWSGRYAADPAMHKRSERFYNGLHPYLSVGSQVLDFGCGSGLVAHHLSTKGYLVTGIDLSPKMIGQARLSGDRANFFVYEGDGTLPFDDDVYDAVISSSVLEYVPNPKEILLEFRRVLKDEGVLLLTVPDMRNRFRKKESIKRSLMLFPPFYYVLKMSRWKEGLEYLKLSCNRFSIREWQTILDDTGFGMETVPDQQGPLVLITARAK